MMTRPYLLSTTSSRSSIGGLMMPSPAGVPATLALPVLCNADGGALRPTAKLLGYPAAAGYPTRGPPAGKVAPDRRTASPAAIRALSALIRARHSRQTPANLASPLFEMKHVILATLGRRRSPDTAGCHRACPQRSSTHRGRGVAEQGYGVAAIGNLAGRDLRPRPAPLFPRRSDLSAAELVLQCRPLVGAEAADAPRLGDAEPSMICLARTLPTPGIDSSRAETFILPTTSSV